jgi:hypothetical protein
MCKCPLPTGLKNQPADCNRPTIQFPENGWMKRGHRWTINWLGKTAAPGEKPVPVPLCALYIPHGLPWNQTWASTVTIWHLNTWDMALPYLSLPHSQTLLSMTLYRKLCWPCNPNSTSTYSASSQNLQNCSIVLKETFIMILLNTFRILSTTSLTIVTGLWRWC